MLRAVFNVKLDDCLGEPRPAEWSEFPISGHQRIGAPKGGKGAAASVQTGAHVGQHPFAVDLRQVGRKRYASA